MFVGLLAYNWETKEKRLMPYEAPGMKADPSERLYRFWAYLPPPDLGVASEEPLEVEVFEESETRATLPLGQTLADFVLCGISKMLWQLLPGKIVPVQISTPLNSKTIRVASPLGAFEITVKEIL